jgi:protein CpxP
VTTVHRSLRRSQSGFTTIDEHPCSGDRPSMAETSMRDLNSRVLPRQWSVSAVRWIAGSVLVVAAFVVAHAARAQDLQGPGRHGPMHGDAMMLRGGPPEHVARIVDHLLDGLGATDAQRAEIKQIAVGAAADLKAQHDGERALRDRGMQLFTVPNVDAGAAEALRQQMLAQHDQASKRMLQAMLDIAKVLTPEQRAKIGERIKLRQTVMQERMQREHREPPPK